MNYVVRNGKAVEVRWNGDMHGCVSKNAVEVRKAGLNQLRM